MAKSARSGTKPSEKQINWLRNNAMDVSGTPITRKACASLIQYLTYGNGIGKNYEERLKILRGCWDTYVGKDVTDARGNEPCHVLYLRARYAGEVSLLRAAGSVEPSPFEPFVEYAGSGKRQYTSFITLSPTA